MGCQGTRLIYAYGANRMLLSVEPHLYSAAVRLESPDNPEWGFRGTAMRLGVPFLDFAESPNLGFPPSATGVWLGRTTRGCPCCLEEAGTW